MGGGGGLLRAAGCVALSLRGYEAAVLCSKWQACGATMGATSQLLLLLDSLLASCALCGGAAQARGWRIVRVRCDGMC